jgi:hypothetical protein
MTVKFSFNRRYFDADFNTASLDRLKWTKKTFGQPGVRYSWFTRTYVVPTNLGINDLKEVYYFKREKDATLFSLRWS